MEVNNVSAIGFNGKVIMRKQLTKPMTEYANKILDYPYFGTTARERIAKATYDVEIMGRISKKTIHPKLSFYSSFKLLRNPKCLHHCSTAAYVSPKSGVSIHSSEALGATLLNEHLTKFEKYKNDHCYAYNTFGEKIKAFFNRMFG